MHYHFHTFHPLSCNVLSGIIHQLNKTTCVLDQFLTKLLMPHLTSIINIILCIVNVCFSACVFPASCNATIIFPLIKNKVWILRFSKNYRHVANLSFISIIIEKLLQPNYIAI